MNNESKTQLSLGPLFPVTVSSRHGLCDKMKKDPPSPTPFPSSPPRALDVSRFITGPYTHTHTHIGWTCFHMLVCLQAISHPGSPGEETGKLLLKLLHMVTIADTPWSLFFLFFLSPGLFRPAALLQPSSTPPRTPCCRWKEAKKKNLPHTSAEVSNLTSLQRSGSLFFSHLPQKRFSLQAWAFNGPAGRPRSHGDETARAREAGSRGQQVCWNLRVQPFNGRAAARRRDAAAASLSLPPSITSAER